MLYQERIIKGNSPYKVLHTQCVLCSLYTCRNVDDDYVEMGGNSVQGTVQTTDETLKIYETVVVDVQL